MVGEIGGSSPVIPVRGVPRTRAAARPTAAAPARSDWVDISNFSAIDIAVLPGGSALSRAKAGEGALGEAAGFLGELKTLVTPDSGDDPPEETHRRQVKADAILASMDRLARTAQFDGSPLLDGSMLVSTAGGSVTLPQADAQHLGKMSVDGKQLSLADLRSGGAVPLGSAMAMQIVTAAIQTIAGSQQQLGRADSQLQSAAPSMGDLAAIRQSILAGASAAVREPNRAAMLHLLK